MRPVSDTPCLGRRIAALEARFRDGGSGALAQQVVLREKSFHMRLLGSMEDMEGDRDAIASIERVEWCTDSPPPIAPTPHGACREPRQFAVAFDYGAPLSNRILTNGFSFHLALAGSPPSGFDLEGIASQTLASFARALTMWTAAMQDNDALLTPATRAFVRSRTSTSAGGYTLLTPPQVIRLRCPRAATFVVQLNFGSGGVFPIILGSRALAKAQVEGRTIALNMRDVSCFKTMTDFAAGQLALRDDGCDNLLPVITHELGHAFGLDHIPLSTGPALMNPVLSAGATTPTPLDVRALVAALERSVAGARPGELEFRSSAPLLAPPLPGAGAR